MDFKAYLKDNAQWVERILDEILLEFVKETKKANIKLSPFAKSFLNSCRGGKRIRGILVNLGYEIALPTKFNYDIYKIGAAFEILHTALLIHDDIIDQSPKRRGQPSLYMALGGNHYGISQAISLGDIGLYLPIKIITKTSFSAEPKIKALNYFSQILINTGWGQIMDMEKSPVDLSSKDKDIEFVNLYKTAKYTIAGPLQLGAILAGAEKRLVKKLGEFGENLGIAFQIQDDILDKEIKDEDKARAQELEYASKAKKMIPGITKNNKFAKMLEGMSDYLIERIY